MHWDCFWNCCALHKNYYNIFAELDSEFIIGYNGITIKVMEVHSYVENSRIGNAKVTTVCNGKCEIWTDREEAKDFFIRQMMIAEGEECDRAECIYIQLMHDLSKCSDE